MGLREEIQRKIERKQVELADLERGHLIAMAGARAYIQALQDMLKSVPREDAQAPDPETVLRPGSSMARTREAILAAGKPLHVNELLKAINRPVDHGSRVSVSSSLATYVRKGIIFTRPAPNTFGLIELGHRSGVAVAPQPPDGFGATKPRPADLVTFEGRDDDEIDPEDEMPVDDDGDTDDDDPL